MPVSMFRNSQPSGFSGGAEPDAHDVEQLARRAAALAGRGDTARAMRAYQIALLTDEARADLWLEYGMLQARLGQLADAQESFEFALRQEPLLYKARHHLGLVCCETARPLEALSHFRQVVQQRPGYVPAWRYVVQITWALGNLTEAEARAREALQHAPGDAELASMLGRIAQDRNDASSDMQRVPQGA